MPHFDAKTLDGEIDGAALLAAVLHPSPAARAEARERGRQRLARAGTFAEAFAVAPAGDRAARRMVKTA